MINSGLCRIFACAPNNGGTRCWPNWVLPATLIFRKTRISPKRFHLTSNLEELARQKFSPELQKFLLGGPRIHVEGSNYYLIAYQPRKVFRSEEACAFFERCCQLTALLQGENKQELMNLVEWEAPEKKRRSSFPPGQNGKVKIRHPDAHR